MPNIVGLKEFRENMEAYISQIEKGKSFVIVRRSKPVFKVSDPFGDDGVWETVIDFTSIRKAGIPLEKILKRVRRK